MWTWPRSPIANVNFSSPTIPSPSTQDKPPHNIPSHPLFLSNWGFLEKNSLDGLRISFRGQTWLLTTKSTPLTKARKHFLQKKLHRNPTTPRSLELLEYFELRYQCHCLPPPSTRAASVSASNSGRAPLTSSVNLAFNFFSLISRNKRMGIRIQRLLHPGGFNVTTDIEIAGLLKKKCQNFYLAHKGSTPPFHPRTKIHMVSTLVRESQTQRAVEALEFK